MLYRKAAPNPPRLLLRIVATAGAGALLGVAACSSSSANGSSPIVPAADAADNGDLDANQIITGVLPSHPDATVLPCGAGGVCGLMVLPHDGDVGDEASPGESDAGAEAGNDAAADAEIPDSGTHEAPDGGIMLHCPPICGVVVHP